MKAIFYLSCFFLFTASWLSAQGGELVLDSMNLVVEERLRPLRAAPPVENKVRNAEGLYRLEMLMREWWDMPTQKEQGRLDKGRYDRFSDVPFYADSLYVYKPRGLRYRERDAIKSEQNLTVMGWHPYWAGEDFRFYNFKLLTHLCYYGYELNPYTGGYRNFEAIHGFQNSGIIREAHLDSCKVLLTVSCFGANNTSAFFMSADEARNNLIDSLSLLLAKTDADGIDLMFTEIPIEFKWDFIYFVKELSFALRENNNNYTIALHLPSQDPDYIYDMGHLGAWVDLFILPAGDFHIEKTRLVKRPASALRNADAATRPSLFTFSQLMTLDSVLRTNATVSGLTILHDDAYIKALTDTLAVHVGMANLQVDYNSNNLADLLKIVRLYEPLQRKFIVRDLLERTRCIARYNKTFQAAKPLRFFLFSPNADTLITSELDLFGAITDVRSNKDSADRDISDMVEYYRSRLGAKHSASFVLGLPMNGSVWNLRANNEFEGYMPFYQIRELLRERQGTVVYDRLNNTMVGTLYDSLGPTREIYFDNTTTLQRKMRYAMDANLGGVGVSFLSSAHGSPELWAMLEEEFVMRRIWNKEKFDYVPLKIEKSNKIAYLIEYQIRRHYRLILATVLVVSLFLAITFAFSLLDWRVRDVMFYSQAFRLFYLTLFSVLTLLLSNWLGIFENKTSSLFLGIVLGAILTWLATFLVVRQQERLP